jgi:hypothetical protein
MMVFVLMLAMLGRVMMVMFMVMMLMSVLVVTLMRVTMAMVVVIVVMLEVHIKLHARDALTLLSSDMQVVIIQLELRQFPLEFPGIHTQIDQGANEHVAADAAEDVEIESFHSF